METREKIIEKYNLTPPTTPELKDKFERTNHFELRIIFLVKKVDQNLYSFICGIVTGIPISIVFNLMDMNVSEMPYEWCYFVLYLMLLLDTVVMTVAAITFTLLHIKIHEKANHKSRVETYSLIETFKNELYQQIFDSMKILKREYRRFVIAFFVFGILVIILFAFNNFDFSWLLNIINKTTQPLATT